MIEPAHVRYQSPLMALTKDGPVLDTLTRTKQWQQWRLSHRTWVRTHGRFDPDHAPFATLVFETVDTPQRIVRVEVFAECPPSAGPEDALVRHPTIGWLRTIRFPSDPALTTLPAVLAGVKDAAVVRYRPHRRCTFRVDDGGRGRFAKVFPDNEGARLHREGIALWQAANRGELGFLVAQPDRWDHDTHTLWQEQIDGRPAAPHLFGQEAAPLAHRMGQAVASLTRSTLHPQDIFDGPVQLARSRRSGEDLVRRIPRLAPCVHDLLETLSRTHATFAGRPLRPIHGAPHPHQWLEDGTQLGLVDFDRIALGDPELDVATFLGELDFEEALQTPVAQLADAFLTGYESLDERLDRRLLAAYRAHKRLAKAVRSARAVRPDGDQRAARNLGRALVALQEPA